MTGSEENLIRIFIKGGIISPSDLIKVMEIALAAGNKYIMFGSRQDILFSCGDLSDERIKSSFLAFSQDFEIRPFSELKISDQRHNIVTSYVALNIMESTSWVNEGTYQNLLGTFDYSPKLKINLVDPKQSLVPLFTGHLNFIASTFENYWFLYVRTKDENENLTAWPRLVSSSDLPKLSRLIELALASSPGMTVDELFVTIQAKTKINYKKIEEPLNLPDALFPYYEGLNAMLNNLYWLGLYWRDNHFNIDFLTAACKLCQDTEIGNLSITPWKSFVIKGIKQNDRIRWEKLMGKYGINLRHSSLELNWHLPVLNEEAQELKKYLVRELDQQDISTHGLTFTIKTEETMLLFTSVVIEKCKHKTPESEPSYDILYAKEFNPNLSEYHTFTRSVKKDVIPALLIELSKIYFRQLNFGNQEANPGSNDEKELMVSSYQCSNCLTVYDKTFGDPESEIKAGTPFEKLPDHYKCSVCNSGKEFFRPVLDY